MSVVAASPLKLPERVSLFGVPVPAKFLKAATSLDIYLDEQWSFDPSRSSEAIVSGIVAHGGHAPNVHEIPNHLFQMPWPSEKKLRTAAAATNSLLGRNDVFPFVLDLSTFRDQAKNHREPILAAAVRILLGSLLIGRTARRRLPKVTHFC